MMKELWISAAEKLPKRRCEVLTVTTTGFTMILRYNPKHKLFNVSDEDTSTAIPVAFWLPIPEAPDFDYIDD